MNRPVSAITAIKPQRPIQDDNDDFLVVRHSKRRNESPTSPKGQQKQPKISNWLSERPKTNNRYEILSDNKENDEIIAEETKTDNRYEILSDNRETEEETDRNQKIPPIFVSGIEQIRPLTEMLEACTGGEYEIRTIGRSQVNIRLKTIAHYTDTVKELKNRKIEFHSFQLPGDKTFKVVVKNLHQTTDKEDLKSELEQLGHEVLYINNIMKKGTRIPMPLFMLELRSKNNNKSIYDIQRLMHTIVKIEPPKYEREIVQCTNCQRYGHSKRYCHRQPRCVKCTENHHTSNCTRKSRNDKVKCTLCGNNHPANYKGCRVYIEIRNKKFKSLRPRTLNVISTEMSTALAATSSECASSAVTSSARRPNVSYAQATRGQQQQIISNRQEKNINSDNNNNGNNSDNMDKNNNSKTHQERVQDEPSTNRLERIMEQLMEGMNRIMSLLTKVIEKCL